MDTEELSIQRAKYKLYSRFLLCGGSVPLTSLHVQGGSTVVCSLDILILALGDPMHRASLNIPTPRFHLATSC